MFGNDIDYTCATDTMKKVPPHHGPSSNSEHKIFDWAMTTMSASSETYDDSVQVVEMVIDIRLIDNAVADLPAGSNTGTDDITTGIVWTPACEEIRKFYTTKVHEKVCSKDDIDHYTDTISRSSLKRRLLVSSKRLRRHSLRSRWLSVSTQPFRTIPFVESAFLPITMCLFRSLSKGYHPGLKYGLSKNTSRCRGRRDR